MIFDALWRTQWRRRRYIRETSRKIKELRETHNYKEANELDQESELELHLWYEGIQVLRTQVLMAKAERLGLPLPADEDGNKVWRHSQEDASLYLTKKAHVQLSKDIRQEQKERLELKTAVIKDIIGPISALIISILSLLIAYAALKLKH
jgi:hypothetical protein